MHAHTHSSRWTLTENKEPYLVLERLKTLTEVNKTLTYVIAQVEQGTHMHLQAYLQTSRSQRLSWLKKNITSTGHFEAAKGSAEENKSYCSKQESRMDGPWEYGTLPTLGRKPKSSKLAVDLFSDLKAGIAIPKLIEDHFAIYSRHSKAIDKYIELTAPQRNLSAPPEVIVHYGIPGSGKSRAVRQAYPDAYYKPVQSKWWSGYDGQMTVVFDDYNGSWFSWSTLMQVLDLYPCKVETKGGHTELLASRFVFTTNVNPCAWYSNAKCPQEALIRRITQLFYYTSKEAPPDSYNGDDKDNMLRQYISDNKSSEAAMSRED